MAAKFLRVCPSATGELYSPVDFIVVIVNFPPEVKPDEGQEEGRGEDEEPEALPLWMEREVSVHTVSFQSQCPILCHSSSRNC